MAILEDERFPYLHTGYYEFLESIANSDLADDVESGGLDFPASIEMKSFLYEDMGSSLIDNYEFLVSKPTLQQVEDGAYGGPDHFIPIQEQSSSTSFLYEDKGSSLAGYYELLDSNATLQQVEDVACGGPDHGIPIQNERMAIKVEGEHKCKRSFTEFIASLEAEGSYNYVAAHGPQTNLHELGMSSRTSFLYEDKGSSLAGYYELLDSNATLQQVEDVAYGGPNHGIPIQNQSTRNSFEYMGSSPTDYYGFLKSNANLLKVDDVANGGPDYYIANKRQRLMKIEDENEWQRSFRELTALY